jgi:hypothetical protein
VRNLEDLQRHASDHALELSDVMAMPANNFSVIFHRR